MIFFTSDQHFWHANVIKYCNRPFGNVEEMNEQMVRNWNQTVGPDDTVYCLGDFSFAFRSVELYSRRLNGTKLLVPGNHDPVHPYNKHQKKAEKRGEPDEWRNKYEAHGWKVLPLTTELSVDGVANVVMSHMPYDNNDPRYDPYKPVDQGKWLLHGHTHVKEQVRGRMIHVGVDAWNFTPVSLDQIKKIILEQT